MSKQIIEFKTVDQRGNNIKLVAHEGCESQTFLLYVNEERAYVQFHASYRSVVHLHDLPGVLNWLQQITDNMLLEYYAKNDGVRAYKKPKERFT
jgi:hypothetical protein